MGSLCEFVWARRHAASLDIVDHEYGYLQKKWSRLCFAFAIATSTHSITLSVTVSTAAAIEIAVHKHVLIPIVVQSLSKHQQVAGRVVAATLLRTFLLEGSD